MLIIILLTILTFKQTFCVKSDCNQFLTCGDCIANPSCAWCSDNNFEGNRCGEQKYIKGKCKSNVYPTEELEEIIVVNDDAFGVETNKIVQLKPQRIKIKARPGKEIIKDIFYKPVNDYPLDVYYLIDNSYTMIAHKTKLAEEGSKIAKMLEVLTNNVLLGFGTFVEKPDLPYAKKSFKVYSYQNHLSLTNDTLAFASIIPKIEERGNLDIPEAMFDGLMQAMVCKDDIGWREDSLKIIIACTDAPYHSAGDGKFVGAFKPNDMKCHLEDHNYVDALVYDYPSVSQINKIASDKGFIIIFAAPSDVSGVYETLISAVKRSAYAELKNQKDDRSNIVDIVQEQYTKLVQKLKFYTNISDGISLQATPNCIDSAANDCEIKYKEVKKIRLSMTFNSCSKPNQFEITTQSNDKLIVDVEVICSCPCEKGNHEFFNKRCSSNGKYQCGICKCNENRYGDHCECDGLNSDMNIYDNMNKCKLHENNTEVCSGRGTCSCGQCTYCEEGFSGPFCEYDEKRCLNTKNEMCSNNGECIRGICSCKENSGWTGEFCNCQERNCIAPYSEEVCSGRGKCDCGKCVCNQNNTDNNLYIGEYCDYCESCVEKRCELNNHISEICKIVDEEVICGNSTTDYTIIMAPKKDFEEFYENAKWCALNTNETGCSIFYKYKYVNMKLVLIVQEEKDCPPKTDKWIIIGSTIGSILLVGLLTAIVWKILVDLHDEREFEKFKLECTKIGFDTSMNPLYREPHTNFINPAFQQSS